MIRRSRPDKSTLLPPLKKLSDTLRRRSLVVLISDFYEDPDDVVSALSHVRGRGNDMMVFHLLDPREVNFSFADASNFIDMETGDKMPIIPEYLREQYRELVSAHTAALAKRIVEARADYTHVRHVQAARSGAVQLPGRAPAIQPGAVT